MTKNKWYPLYVSFFVILLFSTISYMVPHNIQRAINSDDGLIQQLNIHVLTAAVFLCLLNVIYSDSKRNWIGVTIIMTVYALREMDFHVSFTNESVTRLKFYTRDKDPLSAKLIAGAILLIFAIAVIHLAITHFKTAHKEFKAKKTWPIYLMVWAALLIFSQVVDRDYIKPLKILRPCEEPIELGTGVLMLSTLWYFSHGMIQVSKEE